MKKRNEFLKIIVFAILIGCTFNNYAGVLRVNNQGFSADYTDLQVAINNANTNDTIHVEASGVPYAGVVIYKSIVLIGPGYFLSLDTGLQKKSTPASIQGMYLGAGSAGSVISGVSIDLGGGFSPLNIDENNITIERCYVRDGIILLNGGTINNILIRQCYIYGGLGHNTSCCPGAVNNLNISNCYFGNATTISAPAVSNNYQGILSNNVFNNGVDGYSAGVIYQNNIIKGGTFNQNTVNSISNVQYNLFVASSVPAYLAGGTNLNQVSSVFIPATPSPDKSLQQNTLVNCAPCYQGFPAGTGIMGMFGGAVPYIIGGIPAIPAIYQLYATPNITRGDTIQVTIHTRSNN